MRKILFAIVLALLLSAGNQAAAYVPPDVDWDIALENGEKRYTYTLTNTATDSAGNPLPVSGFRILLPATGAKMVTRYGAPVGWTNSTRIAGTVAIIWWGSTTPLQYGESAALSFWTAESTPTAYSWIRYPLNWEWYFAPGGQQAGDSFVPIPVPEPSSLLALSGGILGFGALRLRKRPL